MISKGLVLTVPFYRLSGKKWQRCKLACKQRTLKNELNCNSTDKTVTVMYNRYSDVERFSLK